MPELTLWLTRNMRTDRVNRSIAGISNISDYDSPEKWEDTISLLMLTKARDDDAKMYKPDTTKHVRVALEAIAESNILEDLKYPLTRTGREIFNQKMTNLIVSAADSVDQRMDWSTPVAFILLLMFWPVVFIAAALTYWLNS